MVVPFVEIGGIVDHHCLNFLFIISGKNHLRIDRNFCSVHEEIT